MNRLIKQLMQKFTPDIEEPDTTNFDNYEDAFINHEEVSSQHNNINRPLETAGLLKKVKKRLYEALLHYFPDPSGDEWLSALLDPRSKSLDFLDSYDKLEAEQYLRKVFKILKDQEESECEKETRDEYQMETSDDPIDETPINPIYVPSLLKSLEKPEVVADDEVGDYLKLPEIYYKNDPFAWWKDHANKLPTLATLARIYLPVPAASTASECLFSDAGYLLAAKRNSMKPELFKRMMFLKRNYNQFESVHPPFQAKI